MNILGQKVVKKTGDIFTVESQDGDEVLLSNKKRYKYNKMFISGAFKLVDQRLQKKLENEIICSVPQKNILENTEIFTEQQNKIDDNEEERNYVLDIIIFLIKGLKNNKVDTIYKGKVYTLNEAKYLLEQTIRQYTLSEDHYFVSKRAMKLWSQISYDNIFKYYYTRKVVCDKNAEIIALSYIAGSNKPNPVLLKNGTTFTYRSIFHDEYIVPINVIIEEFKKLEKLDYESVAKILDKVYICKMLKEESHKIIEKNKRPLCLIKAVEKTYTPCKIDIADWEKISYKYKLCCNKKCDDCLGLKAKTLTVNPILENKNYKRYRTNAEFLNDNFGTNYKQYMRCGWIYHQLDICVWMCEFDEKVRSGWKNTIIDEETIYEEYVGREADKLPSHKNFDNKLRLAVCKSRGFKKLGIYRYDGRNSDVRTKRIWKKISNSIEEFKKYNFNQTDIVY